METLVLDIINSYGREISTVEELVSVAYETAVGSDDGLAALDNDRERLKHTLQEMLVKNCSLRRKDFGRLVGKILSESERNRNEIKEEQKLIREQLKEHLDDQKELATCLRKQLVEFMQGRAGKDSLEVMMSNFEAAYQDKGEQILTLLRDFQLRLKAFQRQSRELNGELQSLANKGQSLRIEDLKQLEAAKARQDRELRLKHVEKLLTHSDERCQTRQPLTV